MSTLEEIESAIAQLPREQLAQFRLWFDQFAADAWDRQIEEDAQAGRLDHLVEKALREHEAGLTSEL
jgi:hypothetical protein